MNTTMPDPNHIPGYDAWKTAGPDEAPEQPTIKDVELSISVCTVQDIHPTTFANVLKARIESLFVQYGFPADDYTVSVETASERDNQ